MTDWIRSPRFAVPAALCCGLGAPAAAADIALKNAWMRPERAGAA